MYLGNEFERALIYALWIHGGHTRKGTQIPYFSHLMAVAATVIENEGTETEAIAALLHDAVEDQGGEPRLKDIRDRFGGAVAEIVEACSDSLDSAAGVEKEEWLPRKRRYLKSLPKKSKAILRVSLADKLHNARAIFRDAQTKEGAPVWERFNKPREQTIAYYAAFYEIVADRFSGPLVVELNTAINNLKTEVQDKAAYEAYLNELLAA
jgi:(p)ppGpp synthase/HD superfamily hydrolase